jgi:hypothetical protein
VGGSVPGGRGGGRGGGQRGAQQGRGNGGRPQRDLSTMICNRCQQTGHSWRTCEAKVILPNAHAAHQVMPAMMGPPMPPPYAAMQAAPYTQQPMYHMPYGAPSQYSGHMTYAGPPRLGPPPSSQGELLNISLSVLSPNMHDANAVSWVVDSGASIHVVNDMSLLHNPRMHSHPVPLKLATTDGVGEIIATGSVCILNSRSEPLWIHQVHCVPSATLNLLSVSAAIRDGAVFHCDPKGAYTQLCGPLGWECTIVHDRGLYFLQHVLPSCKGREFSGWL